MNDAPTTETSCICKRLPEPVNEDCPVHGDRSSKTDLSQFLRGVAEGAYPSEKHARESAYWRAADELESLQSALARALAEKGEMASEITKLRTTISGKTFVTDDETSARLTDSMCDEIVAALETYEFKGFSRDDIRLIAGTIETYRTPAEKTDDPLGDGVPIDKREHQPEKTPECSTCNDTGEIDETLGGIARSNPHAPCPDCRSEKIGPCHPGQLPHPGGDGYKKAGQPEKTGGDHDGK